MWWGYPPGSLDINISGEYENETGYGTEVCFLESRDTVRQTIWWNRNDDESFEWEDGEGRLDQLVGIRENARKRFQGDPQKVAVLGSSAGGHLALTCGFRLRPRPDALVICWGYGDSIGPWLRRPSAETLSPSKRIQNLESSIQDPES